jgi:hypothetical protein
MFHNIVLGYIQMARWLAEVIMIRIMPKQVTIKFLIELWPNAGLFLISGSSLSGTLFGNDLTKQVEQEGRTIPLLVERCIAAVQLRGMDYEGIYRKSGGAAQMKSIQLSFEQGLDPDLTDDDEYNDICAVTSILKQYFRELPNPLITYDLYPEFLESIGKI